MSTERRRIHLVQAIFEKKASQVFPKVRDSSICSSHAHPCWRGPRQVMFLLPDPARTRGWTNHFPAAYSFTRLKRQYPRHQMLAAIEKVHWGASVARAAGEHGVPRRTLSYRLLNCKKGHPGKCGGAYLRHPEFAGSGSGSGSLWQPG